MTFEDIVRNPDEVGGTKLVKVLFSDAIGMTNDGDEEMFIDTDGNLDDIDGADVTLALALEDMTGVELLAEIVGLADAEEVPEAVMFKEIVGSPVEGEPLDEVLLDKIGSRDEAELVWDPLDELFNEAVGNPEEAFELGNPDRAVTLSEIKSGIVPEELFGIVGTPDGANVVENPVNELLKESVGNLDAAVDDVVAIIDGLELLEEGVGIPDEAEEVPL